MMQLRFKMILDHPLLTSGSLNNLDNIISTHIFNTIPLAASEQD